MDLWDGERLRDAPEVTGFLHEQLDREPLLTALSQTQYLPRTTGDMGTFFQAVWAPTGDPVVVKLNVDDDPSWASDVDQSVIDGHAGTAYLDLGQHARAREYLQRALGHRPYGHARQRAAHLIRLAEAHLRLDDIGAAQDAIGQASALINGGVGSAQLTAELARCGAHLAVETSSPKHGPHA